MGYTEQEITEDDINKSDERKRNAIELYSEQKYDEAVNAYTEAILLNPSKYSNNSSIYGIISLP